MTVDETSSDAADNKERIAKRLARAGVCSRRDAEQWIIEGRVRVNGKTLTTPAVKVGPEDKIEVDGKILGQPSATRLWLFHKPKGLVTTARDEKGRPTVFDALPKGLPRVMSVGRLDINSEGLLLLTNDGALARELELPATGLARTYRVRVHGYVTQSHLENLEAGITVDGVRYGSILARMQQPASIATSANVWLNVTLKEGKNREIRRVMTHLGLMVNRLIRTGYGPFKLGELSIGEVEEVPQHILLNFIENMRK